MAGLRKLSTRIVNKHATAAVWNSTNFTPLQGELIVYDPGYDSKDGKTYTRARIKMGDGTHTVQELPFMHELTPEVAKQTNTIDVITRLGIPTYTPAKYVAPDMSQTSDSDTLTILFNSGSYTPATFEAGEATTSSITYLTDVDVTLVTPE